MPSKKYNIIYNLKQVFEKDYMFNSRKFLIPFQNGVYDLINNNFRQYQKTDLFTNDNKFNSTIYTYS